MNPFTVLFEDPNVLVLEKAPGVLSQGDHSGDTSLVDHLRTYFGRHYVGLIHRLDRNTSGIMIVGKRSKSADRLSQQLREGTLDRAYLAILEGNLTQSETWDDLLVKDTQTNQSKVVRSNSTHPDATKARLHVRPVQNSKSHTLALFTLETGRSHQIRVQSAHRGFPLVGDQKYGKSKETFLALHSAFLKFQHPIEKTEKRFHSLPPQKWFKAFPELFKSSDDLQAWMDQIQPFK